MNQCLFHFTSQYQSVALQIPGWASPVRLTLVLPYLGVNQAACGTGPRMKHMRFWDTEYLNRSNWSKLKTGIGDKLVISRHKCWYWLVVWNMFYFLYTIWNSNPNWLSYFSEGFCQPPSNQCGGNDSAVMVSVVCAGQRSSFTLVMHVSNRWKRWW